MRLTLLPILAAITLALAAPVASARPIDRSVTTYQDLRSPDARDANDAVNAQSLQDIIKAHEQLASRFTGPTKQDKNQALLAQEKYYSSYGTAKHSVPADDSSPWPAIGVGLALILVVAGAVALAVRTRRHTVRVAV